MGIAQNNPMRTDMSSWFDEECPVPAGTVIMRRFPVGEYKIVWDVHGHNYAIIDSKLERIVDATTDYMNCLNWCKKHGCSDQIQK